VTITTPLTGGTTVTATDTATASLSATSQPITVTPT
jgi:hypothetical protein